MPRTTDTGERLLTLAMEQLDTRGEKGLRVNELCSEVGVPVTSLYHFFGSREGLVEAAYAELYIRNLHEELEAFIQRTQACTNARQFREMLYATLTGFVGPEPEGYRMRRMHILGAAYRRPGLQKALARAQTIFFQDLARVVLSLQMKGWVRPELETKGFAAWFQGQLLGEVLVLLDGSEVSTGQWLEVSIQAVFAVLFGDVPGTPLP